VTLELASRPEPRHAPLDLVGVLRAEREGFTLSQKLLSDMVLADVGAVLRMSIVDLANQAEVSPPTVTRFCRRLGCDSYAEFKLRLAQSNFVGQRYNLPQRGPDTIDDIAHVVVDGIHGAVNDVVRHLDAVAMERAAEAIAAADYVIAFGSGGSSSMIASETEARLFRLGIKVSCSIDHQAQMMRAAGAPAGTVLVAYSLSGNNLPLARALAAGGDNGLTRIVVTRSKSPVAAQADILIPVDRDENPDIVRPTPGRYAFLAILDILSQSVATKLGGAAVASMRRIKHQLVLNRDLDDGQPLGD
jgi:DNA-binding MurR/RpiR family transcriptional regulator